MSEKINGYRKLTVSEVSDINDVKQIGEDIETLVLRLKTTPDYDPRWIAIAVTELQQGLMALTRSIARPTNF